MFSVGIRLRDFRNKVSNPFLTAAASLQSPPPIAFPLTSQPASDKMTILETIHNLHRK